MRENIDWPRLTHDSHVHRTCIVVTFTSRIRCVTVDGWPNESFTVRLAQFGSWQLSSPSCQFRSTCTSPNSSNCKNRSSCHLLLLRQTMTSVRPIRQALDWQMTMFINRCRCRYRSAPSTWRQLTPSFRLASASICRVSSCWPSIRVSSSTPKCTYKT